EARRSAAEADWERQARPEPRRWALSAYADLDEEAGAEDARATTGEQGDAGGAEQGDAAAATGPAAEGGGDARGSHAQRVDRAWRKAQREQRRLDRAEMDDSKREAKAA